MAENAVFHVLLTVCDEDLLRAAAERHAGSPAESLDEAICDAVVNPASPPLDCGFEIVRKLVLPCGESHVLEVECLVTDRAAVASEARARYEACWQDGAWVPEHVQQALYEILVASNHSLSPLDCGFEIRDCVEIGEAIPVPQMRPLMRE